MNRRIYVPEEQDSKLWRTVSTIFVFVFVFIVCAALSIDDYQPRNPNTDTLQPCRFSNGHRP